MNWVLDSGGVGMILSYTELLFVSPLADDGIGSSKFYGNMDMSSSE